jgi:hypothetical protein
MNRIVQAIVSLFVADERSTAVLNARYSLERAAHTRGLSRFDANQLSANAQAMLTLVR